MTAFGVFQAFLLQETPGDRKFRFFRHLGFSPVDHGFWAYNFFKNVRSRGVSWRWPPQFTWGEPWNSMFFRKPPVIDHFLASLRTPPRFIYQFTGITRRIYRGHFLSFFDKHRWVLAFFKIFWFLIEFFSDIAKSAPKNGLKLSFSWAFLDVFSNVSNFVLTDI